MSKYFLFIFSLFIICTFFLLYPNGVEAGYLKKNFNVFQTNFSNINNYVDLYGNAVDSNGDRYITGAIKGESVTIGTQSFNYSSDVFLFQSIIKKGYFNG